MKHWKALGLALLAAIALTACTLGASEEAAAPPPEDTPAPAQTEPAPTDPAAMTDAPESTMIPEATLAPSPTSSSDEIPRGSPALKASNPNQVSLTGDKPRLVEFFAFW